jgi:hypothetical protein
MRAHRRASGKHLRRQFAAQLNRKGGQGDAHVRGKRRGVSRGHPGYLKSPESSGNGRRYLRLRQGISPAWQRNPEEKEVENGEESGGVLIGSGGGIW